MSEVGEAKRRKRPDGEGGVRQRRDGRWEARLTVTAPDGSRVPACRYAKTEKEAHRLLRSMATDASQGKVISTRRLPTVKEYGESWLTGTLRSRVAMGQLAPATWNNYHDLWMTHVVPHLGHRRLDALTPVVLRAWLADVAASKKGKDKDKHISASTVRAVHATLRKALKDAIADGLPIQDHMRAVRGPSVPDYKAKFLTKEEAARLRTFSAEDPLGPLVLVLLGCGLRIGEGLALRWSDIDIEGRRIYVRGTVGDLPGDMTLTGNARPRGVKATKTAASNAPVPLPKFVIEALKTQRAAVAKQRLASPAWDDQDLVFPSVVGTPLDRSNIAKKWETLRDKAGVSGLRLHDLRHSTATFLLAAGAPMKLVQEILRHTRMATTADLYAHVLPEALDGAADLLDSYFAGDSK